MRLDTALFAAQLFTLLNLGAGLAHLYALPNKMKLSLDTYLAVNRIYNGWALLGIAVVLQAVGLIAAALLARHRPGVFRPVLVALACLVLAQVLFWFWTQPANVATSMWTALPANGEALRRQWEFSHAVAAILQLVAALSLMLAALRTGRRDGLAGPEFGPPLERAVGTP